MKSGSDTFSFNFTIADSMLNALLTGEKFCKRKKIHVVKNFKGRDKCVFDIEMPCDDKNMPSKIIANNGATVFIYDDATKIILYRDKKDAYNLEYAFCYAYFLRGSGLSKTGAHKFFNKLV